MGTASTAATHSAGIDVSTDTLDADLLGPGGRTRPKRFANDPAGFAALRGWAERHAAGGAVHYRTEATGPYSAALAEYLHAAGLPVGVPSRLTSSVTGTSGRTGRHSRNSYRVAAGDPESDQTSSPGFAAGSA